MEQNYSVYINIDKVKKSQNNIILFGEVGSGKTTLINKLCNTKYKVEEGGYSCTRDNQFGYTPTHDIVIDCPGLNAAEEISRHLNTQKFILSIIPVKIICFVVKLYTRYDLIFKAVVQMYKIFHEHKNNIVIIITFSEKLSGRQKKDIQNFLAKKLGFDDKKIIFSSNNVKSGDLLQKLNEVKDKMSNINSIRFNEKTLISSDIEGGLEINEFRENKMNEYKCEIQNFETQWNRPKNNLLQYALLKTFNYYQSKLIDSFREKLKNKIEDIDTINVETIIFSNELYERLNTITESFEKKLSNNQLKNLDIEAENPSYGIIINELKYKDFIAPIKINIIYGKFKFCKIIINLDNYGIYIIEENNNNNAKKSVEKMRTEYNISDSDSELVLLYKTIVDNMTKLSLDLNKYKI